MNALREAARRMLDAEAAPAGVAIGLRSPAIDSRAAVGKRDASAAMTTDTVHDLASVTKIVATATSLIRLVSDGGVGLDDPVVGYVPEFAGGAKDAVTVRQLLLHRGGLWEWQPLYLHARGPDEALRHAARIPLRYAPDTGRRYSDLGFMLLGRVVEVAAGQPLADAVDELVATPLGLGSTRYGGVGADVAASAVGDATERAMVADGVPYPVLRPRGFDGWREHPIVGDVNDGNTFHALGGVSGHAGLFAPLGDLLSFASALSDYRAHDTLWDPRVVETFLANGPDTGQSLGFRSYPFHVGDVATTMYGHPGFVGCVVGFAPDLGVGLALCSNRLLTPATPVATDTLWTQARDAAGSLLSGLFLESRR